MLQNINKIYINQAGSTSNIEKKDNTLIVDCFFVLDYGAVNDGDGKNVGTKTFAELGEPSFKKKVDLKK